jgi:hypothetical protein
MISLTDLHKRFNKKKADSSCTLDCKIGVLVTADRFTAALSWQGSKSSKQLR